MSSVRHHPLMLTTAIGDLVIALEARKDEIVELQLSRMRLESPDAFASDDPAFLEAGRRSCQAHIQTVIDALGRGRDVPLEPPPAALEEARVTAQEGVRLDALLQTYRIGQSVFWEIAMDEAEEKIGSPEVRLNALRVISRFLFAYVDAMLPAVTAAYERERDGLFRDRERRKHQLVRDLLAGLPVDTSQLTYELMTMHIGVVAWGKSPEQAIVRLATQGKCQVLTVPGTAGAIWGWLGGSSLQGPSARPLYRFRPESGTYLALGEPLDGIAGFQRSHRQAGHAYRVGLLCPQPMTRYRDVSMLALMLQDQEMARAFVAEELGDIAEEDERAEVLRQTLSAYFAAGQNATSAAAMLGVHDRTVAYRIRSIEDRFGEPVVARRGELTVALRLAEHFARVDGRD
jgi:hypothetical protein